MGGSGRGAVTSGAGAFGLVMLAVLGWWVFSGNGPQGPSGNDARYAVPEVEATAGTGTTPPPPTPPGSVLLDSYVPDDELRLLLNYRVPAACTDALDTPRVVESEVAVTITLTADPDGDDGCTGPSVRRTLPVLLDSALDGRAVLDGSTSPRVRVEPVSATYE